MGTFNYRRLAEDTWRGIRLEQDERLLFEKQLDLDFTVAVGCNMAMMKHIDSLYDEALKDHETRIDRLNSHYKSFRDRKAAFSDSFKEALDSNTAETREKESILERLQACGDSEAAVQAVKASLQVLKQKADHLRKGSKYWEEIGLPRPSIECTAFNETMDVDPSDCPTPAPTPVSMMDYGRFVE